MIITQCDGYKEVELFFDDLCEESQKEFLEEFGSEVDFYFDYLPMVVFPLGDNDEKED